MALTKQQMWFTKIKKCVDKQNIYLSQFNYFDQLFMN